MGRVKSPQSKSEANNKEFFKHKAEVQYKKILMPLIIQSINLIAFLSPLVMSIKEERGNILRKVQKYS